MTHIALKLATNLVKISKTKSTHKDTIDATVQVAIGSKLYGQSL